MTDGMKSSEFWLTLVGVAALLLNGTEFINVPWEVMTAMFIGSGGYAISRGLAKRGGDR